jgi:hypothetical protein
MVLRNAIADGVRRRPVFQRKSGIAGVGGAATERAV